MDQKPTIQELTTHARTAEYNELGVTLLLDNVNLAKCHDYTSMYQLWIMEKGRGATRRSLLNALRAIRQNNVADAYEDYLKTMVSYIVHTSMYTCTYRVDPFAKNSSMLLTDFDRYYTLTLIIS